jgi:hypothetical protein
MRLPADLMVKLSQAVASVRDWVMPLSQQSLFYFNEIVTIRRRARRGNKPTFVHAYRASIPGISRNDFA